MLVTVETTGTLERRMRVELPAERIEKEVESRLMKVGRTAKIKGFRPGKIPAKVVRQHYGRQVREEVLSDLMQKSYSDAVRQENLSPAGGPRIEPVASGDAQSFAYVATFEVLPDVKLKGLEKIKIEKPEVEVSDSDVDDMLENLRRQKATWSDVDRGAGDGDRVIVDFDGKLKGEPVKGGKGEEVPVVLGQGQMLPDFEKGLAGVKAGDETSFKVKFPKDYHADDLAGQKVEFSVKVHRVEEQVLPPLDDSLAETYGVSDGGLAKLRDEVRDNMQREARQKIQADLKDQALKGLLDANPIEVPRALVHQEMHNMQHEAMRQLGIKDHDQAPGLENFKESAEKRVRLGLLLSQYIEDAQLIADPAKLREHVEEMCSGYENAEEMAATYLANPQFMQHIEPLVLENQAVERLIESGSVKAKKFEFSEYMNAKRT